jgi:hypothetical protein
LAHPRKITLPKTGPLVAWLVVVAIGSLTGAALWQTQLRAQSRPAPRFDGASIPVPPEQDRSWAAPATTLPTSLVTATRLLFEQRMADPRGCEYREVEISDRTLVSTHGFVLPAKPGEPRRFAVGWDGVVYPASTVGKPADLDTDVRKLADSLRKSREEGVANGAARSGIPGGFLGTTGRLFRATGASASVESPSALKVCMLLRLGRADLAETLFAGGTTWKPGAGQEPADNRVTYQMLATEWADQMYNRAVDAHGRGDDVIALDTARRVSAFIKAAGPVLDELGFARPRGVRPISGWEAPAFFPNLGQLADLLADQERRAKEPPRGPIPGPDAPAEARSAALIRDLDGLMGSGGNNGITPPGGPALGALAREGDAAVPPLLAVLESDDRLTRAVSWPGSRSGRDDRFIHYVQQPAYVALTAILKTRVIPGATGSMIWNNDPAARKEEAAAIRAYWEKNRGVPELERYFRTLADDFATPAQWFDAAEALAQPADVKGRGGSYMIPARPGGKVPPSRGEPLRGRKSPSVTELMARRVDALDPGGPGYNISQIFEADRMAFFLADWDAKGALPTLRARVARLAGLPRGPQYRTTGDDRLAIDLAEFTRLCQKGGDPGAQENYAAWVRTLTPESYGQLQPQVFEPIWRSPEHPAIAGAADALFADPASPWVTAFLRDPGRPGVDFRSALIKSPLLGVTPFRKLVLEGLTVPMEVGSVETDAAGKAMVRFPWGGYQYSPSQDDPLRPKPGSRMSVRLADYCAYSLQGIGGLARFELYWPEAKRDELIAATAAFLKQYGARIREGENSPMPRVPLPGTRPYLQAVLAFDPLDHAATPDDVREGRAIFSLDPSERRPWALPSFPLQARWTALEIPDDDPGLRGIGPVKRPRAQVEMLQGGTVWQAEEAREGGEWRRYYGFVGRHVRARVPAEEIEFPAPWNTDWHPVSKAFDGRLIPPDGFDDGTRVVRREVAQGGPLTVEVWLRNRRGVDTLVPSDWTRTENGLSLREGLTVRLFRLKDPPATVRVPGQAPPVEEEITARQARRHRGGEPSRTLTPTASVRVLRLDLRDMFPVEAPGRYRLDVTYDDPEAAEGRLAKLSESFAFAPSAASPAKPIIRP